MIITEYDKIRDEYYMTTWSKQDINDELRKFERQHNNVYEEYSKSDYYQAILEQERINKQI